MIYYSYKRRKYYVINNIEFKNENYTVMKGKENV